MVQWFSSFVMFSDIDIAHIDKGKYGASCPLQTKPRQTCILKTHGSIYCTVFKEVLVILCSFSSWQNIIFLKKVFLVARFIICSTNLHAPESPFSNKHCTVSFCNFLLLSQTFNHCRGKASLSTRAWFQWRVIIIRQSLVLSQSLPASLAASQIHKSDRVQTCSACHTNKQAWEIGFEL